MLFELGTLHVKIQGNVFMLPENEDTNIQKKKKKKRFKKKSGNLFSKFLVSIWLHIFHCSQD